jgi:hypothetical protein
VDRLGYLRRSNEVLIPLEEFEFLVRIAEAYLSYPAEESCGEEITIPQFRAGRFVLILHIR